MGDNWDDSDDEWDVGSEDDDELDKRLGLTKISDTPSNKFDDEQDLTIAEKASREKAAEKTLKTKGKALAEKKKAEKDRKEEEELVRKAMEYETQMEMNMSPEERRMLEKKRVEDADNALTDDLFGGVDNIRDRANEGSGKGEAINAGDVVIMKDLKDHLKHARKVSLCMKDHGKVHLAAAFLKECISESKQVLDDDAVTDLIKTLNVIKNEKLAAAKRKVKGQAQKSQKKDKAAIAKAKKIQEELYGENDRNDDYDDYGAQYEDDFF